eukprot:2360999-Amphidinium_carterae.1
MWDTQPAGTAIPTCPKSLLINYRTVAAAAVVAFLVLVLMFDALVGKKFGTPQSSFSKMTVNKTNQHVTTASCRSA